jgi:hypothetical protein
MGATLSQLFTSTDECDRWAEQQARLAAQWNLQKTADLGNRPVVRVPVVGPSGRAEEVTLPISSRQSVDDRLRTLLTRSGAYTGYREDRSRRRQPAFVRIMRFD